MKEERSINNKKITGIQQTVSVKKANCGSVTNHLFVCLFCSFILHLIGSYTTGNGESAYSPHGGIFFGLNPTPLWKFQFRLILSFKNFGLYDPPPSWNFQSPSVVEVWIFSGTP